MATIDALLGQHLTAISITPLTISSAGAISAGSSNNLLAYFNAVAPTQEATVENIKPTWSTKLNEVPLETGDSVTITVIQRSSAANLLTSVIRNCASKRFLIAWTQGTESFSGYYTFRRWQGGIQNVGQNLSTAEFGPMDPGADQVTYTSS